MEKGFENNSKNSKEEADEDFFRALAEKYGLENRGGNLIITKGDTKHFIQKWRKIPLKSNPKGVTIEEYIESILRDE